MDYDPTRDGNPSKSEVIGHFGEDENKEQMTTQKHQSNAIQYFFN